MEDSNNLDLVCEDPTLVKAILEFIFLEELSKDDVKLPKNPAQCNPCVASNPNSEQNPLPASEFSWDDDSSELKAEPKNHLLAIFQKSNKVTGPICCSQSCSAKPRTCEKPVHQRRA